MSCRRKLDFSTSPPNKRPLILTPSKVSRASAQATISALVTSLSPQHDDCFQGELSDGEGVIQLVGFEDKQREELHDYLLKKTAVVIRKCQIQSSVYKGTEKLRVVIKSYSTIEQASSEDQIVIEDQELNVLGSPLISLKDLAKFNEFDRVTVRVTVIEMQEPRTVSNSKVKQDIMLADESDCVPFTLWGADVNLLKEGLSYQLNRIEYRPYNGRPQLSFPKFGASILEIDKLPNVKMKELPLEELHNLDNAEIVAVNELNYVFHCIHCKNQVLNNTKDVVTRCNNCGTDQKVPKYSKLTARLYVQENDRNFTLRAYSDTLYLVTNGKEITTGALLSAPPFSLSYNKYHVIVSVSLPS